MIPRKAKSTNFLAVFAFLLAQEQTKEQKDVDLLTTEAVHHLVDLNLI